MRFVNLSGRSPNQAWLRKAQRLLRELNAAADDVARKQIIEANQAVWKELLPWLRRITKGKCWFSESEVLASIGRLSISGRKARQETLTEQSVLGATGARV